MPRTWLIYALGGGLGHLTRAAALARAAGRLGHRTRIISNSPFAALPIERFAPGCEVTRLPATWERERIADEVTTWLRRVPPDVLVVDTFPRGLGGELAGVLPRLSCRRYWIHRDLAPEYVERFQLRDFAAHYDAVFVPGEPAPLDDLPHAQRTAPWLLLGRDALARPPDARGALRAPVDRRLVLVVGSGTADEISELARLARGLSRQLEGQAVVRFAAPRAGTTESGAEGPEASLELWPLLAVLPGVDVLVSSGGYNLVQEARATRTPLVAFIRKRLYDRQARRVRAEERADSGEAALARIREHLGAARPTLPSVLPDGAGEAAARIEADLAEADALSEPGQSLVQAAS